jgi:polyhydroxyalkanoate synthesis regulator phasin
MPANKKPQLIILIEQEKLDRFKAAAAAIDRSMVWLANDLIDRYLANGYEEADRTGAGVERQMEELLPRVATIEQTLSERLDAIEEALANMPNHAVTQTVMDEVTALSERVAAIEQQLPQRGKQ